MTSGTEPWAACQVCGHGDHTFQHHLNEVKPPEFVRASALRLRELESAGSDIHPLVVEAEGRVDAEDGGRKAWAIWLSRILEELEDTADAPEVAAEIEAFLIGGYST